MFHNTVAKCLAGLSVLVMVAARPALAADNAQFGGPTFNNEAGFNIDISSDKKAFTATFSGLVAKIDGKSSPPIVTRTFSFVLPLSGAAPDLEIPLFVSGFALAQKGANAHIVFSVNEQTSVFDFPSGSDNDFTQKLNYKVGNSTELRITIFLVADRESAWDSTVNLNVTTIDTDILKHRS